MDTLNQPVKTRFNKRISLWFDLTEKYHKQLYEMDKKDYLKYKNMELKDQARLQKAIYKNPTMIIPGTSSCIINAD